MTGIDSINDEQMRNHLQNVQEADGTLYSRSATVPTRRPAT